MPALSGKDKVHEDKVRRWAARLGYGISKSRRRIQLDNRGQYRVIALPPRGCVVLGSQFEASLGDVEAFLQREEQRLRA
jgi:hypothetical protein